MSLSLFPCAVMDMSSCMHVYEERKFATSHPGFKTNWDLLLYLILVKSYAISEWCFSQIRLHIIYNRGENILESLGTTVIDLVVWNCVLENLRFFRNVLGFFNDKISTDKLTFPWRSTCYQYQSSSTMGNHKGILHVFCILCREWETRCSGRQCAL